MTNSNQFIIYWSNNELLIGKRNELPAYTRAFGIKNTQEEAEEYIEKYKSYRTKLKNNEK